MGEVESLLRHGSTNEGEPVCTGLIRLTPRKDREGVYSPCGRLIIPPKHVWRIFGKLSLCNFLFNRDSGPGGTDI